MNISNMSTWRSQIHIIKGERLVIPIDAAWLKFLQKLKMEEFGLRDPPYDSIIIYSKLILLFTFHVCRCVANVTEIAHGVVKPSHLGNMTEYIKGKGG